VAYAADAALGAAAAGYAQTLEWHHKRRRENGPKGTWDTAFFIRILDWMTRCLVQHRPTSFFIIQRWMKKTTGPSAMARLDNPVAHPSGAEGGAACAVRGD
jgi:hypothetical protein